MEIASYPQLSPRPGLYILSNVFFLISATCKVQMDWEHGEGPSGTMADDLQSIRPMFGSEIQHTQSDQLSVSDESEASASNVDADDEQSDWPGNG